LGGLAASCVLLGRGLTAQTEMATDGLRFTLPAGTAFVTVKEFDEGPVFLTRFVIEGTSADEWTQALEILQFSKKGQPKTASLWYDAFKTNGEQHCPGGVWTVLQQDDASVLYERTTADCDGNPPQRSLNRVLYGKKKAFVLIFTSAEELVSADREAWVSVLANASAK